MFTKMYFSGEIQRRAKRDGRNPATGARMRRAKRDGRNPSTGA